MNRFFALLALAILASATSTLFQLDRRPTIDVAVVDAFEREARPVSLPFQQPTRIELLRAQNIRLDIRTHGFDHTAVLTVRYAGPSFQVVNQTTTPYETRDYCYPTTAVSECRVILRLGSEPSRIVIQPVQGDITVHSIDVEIATGKRSTAAGGSLFLYGFLVLLMLGPAIVALRRWHGAEELALILLGCGWIALTGLQGLILALLFVSGGYVAIRAVAAAPPQARPIFAALIAVILVVVLLKFVAPSVAGAFANPGGFSLALPLGISYFAIRIVDLLLTANAGLLRDFQLRSYLAFMLMPHTLPAGPILTFGDFGKGRIREYSVVEFAAGGARVGVGLAKKLAADNLVLPVVASNMNAFLIARWDAEPVTVASMLVANTVYVYLDFSAYSDLAIGSAKAAGRKVPENFDWPLVRSGLRQFWRHWHITLSQWVMRRAYLPVFLRTRSVSISMICCMLIIGLWHAMNLPWVLWAFHHGLAMAAQAKLLTDKPTVRRSRLVSAARYGAGVLFVWAWVSLGHSFTSFASLEVAVRAYLLALWTPISIAVRAF